MIITEENRPKCVKCEKPALTLLGKLWLCGDCTKIYMQKMEEQREKILFEE